MVTTDFYRGMKLMGMGSRLKSFRRKQGLTLEQLAKQTSLSKGFLSQLESNTAQPSMASLKRICDELGVSIGALFETDSSVRAQATNQDAARAGRQPNVRVVRKNRRKALQLPGCRSIDHLLTPDLKGKLEVILAVRQPGETFEAEAWRHEGEEFGLILEGKYELTIDGEVYVLEEGDSIYYPSHLQHSARVIGDKPAKWIWVITPPSF